MIENSLSDPKLQDLTIMDKKIQDGPGFRLFEEYIDEIALFEENIPSPKDTIEFNSNIGFKTEKTGVHLACECSVTCIAGGKIFAKVKVTFIYEFDPVAIEANTDKQDHSIIIPKDTLIYIASKTYGAMRGVLLAKLSTKGIKHVLPLINLSEIITTSFKIKV